MLVQWASDHHLTVDLTRGNKSPIRNSALIGAPDKPIFPAIAKTVLPQESITNVEETTTKPNTKTAKDMEIIR